MKRSFGTNLLYSILAVAGIAFAGFIATFITALFGGMIFYTPLVMVVASGLALYVVIAIFQLWTLRTRNILLASFAGLCLLAVAGHELRQAYINSFAVVDDREVNLMEYQPFAYGTKAVALQQKSAYQLTDDLPRLDGATALYPVYSAFVQAVYPPEEYKPYDYGGGTVICSSTPDAYWNLIKGEADIIFTAAPSISQQKAAKHAGKELTLTPIGREAFVFFVNRHNPVDGLTSAQIRDIYSGKLTGWSAVGGSGKIRAFQRDEDSGSQSMLQKIMGDTPLMTPPKEDIANIMSGIISRTANYRNFKNALGFSFLYYASEMNGNGDIKLLAIDGVTPSKESIRSGEYPFSTELYAVTAGSTNPHVAEFIDWMLSPEGQELVERSGYTAVK
ncbi:PstS family phosphate ABC transporter substrate-binding protein [Paenibacillus tengchongensis]|uniref:PstS family phosphate ABC transporter substrate-binding protein n=1 Tax=Paenibacillus tengchongensis TaxID=2608684 RepID=UPI00124C5E12|nr:substrate-binding domain-containing protein [Paenibacillus tengchongensis]